MTISSMMTNYRFDKGEETMRMDCPYCNRIHTVKIKIESKTVRYKKKTFVIKQKTYLCPIKNKTINQQPKTKLTDQHMQFIL